jgi:hypothetical protein
MSLALPRPDALNSKSSVVKVILEEQMITESHHEEVFAERKGSLGPKVIAALCALLVTTLVFAGYTIMRKRHAQQVSASLSAPQRANTEAKGPPKATVFVDDALLQGGRTTIGGTVQNTSTEKLQGLSVELELKRRSSGSAEIKTVALEPFVLEPQQEGRYSLQLKAQDYSSARIVGLKSGPDLQSVAYVTAPGQKRPLERLESKTITVDKRASKRGEFLNSPDNPARVP